MGRGIRHANDFCSLIFLDSRYDKNQSTVSDVVSSLPEWMTRDLRQVHSIDYEKTFCRFFQPLLSEFNAKKQSK
jgi:Rad3-related DNA helicase